MSERNLRNNYNLRPFSPPCFRTIGRNFLGLTAFSVACFFTVSALSRREKPSTITPEWKAAQLQNRRVLNQDPISTHKVGRPLD